METKETRVRIAYKVSAKGQFQPEVTNGRLVKVS